MDKSQPEGVLELFRHRTLELVKEHGLAADPVEAVSARPLTPEEAIGKPDRSDFPIQKGKEFMMEARYRESRGQAFTSMPDHFQGTVGEALGRELLTDFDRALVVATANAVLAQLGLAEKTAHCRDDGPRQCASQVVEYLDTKFDPRRVAVIGRQPALIAALKERFDVRVTDLDADKVGTAELGVLIEGVESTQDVIHWADVVLVTGTVLANDTIEEVVSTKPTVFYGVTIAGAAVLLGLERYCPSAV